MTENEQSRAVYQTQSRPKHRKKVLSWDSAWRQSVTSTKWRQTADCYIHSNGKAATGNEQSPM